MAAREKHKITPNCFGGLYGDSSTGGGDAALSVSICARKMVAFSTFWADIFYGEKILHFNAPYRLCIGQDKVCILITILTNSISVFHCV